MDAASQFTCQHCINPALALDTRKPGECFRHDAHAEMGFTLAAIVAGRARMTGMVCAFVMNGKLDRRKSSGELFMDPVGNAHDRDTAVWRAQSQAIALLVF